MTACNYYDCGWCYAPDYLKTNAIQGGCFEPEHCPNFRNSKPVQYETPMTEIEAMKAQIKVLQSKLSFLEELENTKSPYEEGYKRVFGYYPVTDVGDAHWEYFQKGYEQAQRDYKVGEYQEPEEQASFVPKEIKELVKEGVKWCEEHPDKDPLDYLKPQTPGQLNWVKPQTPGQVEQGLKEAFREAVKQGVVSFTKPKTLYQLIEDWWSDVFTTHSDWDMETSIANLVDEISLWLPTEHCTNSYKWNQCIRMIREKLR